MKLKFRMGSDLTSSNFDNDGGSAAKLPKDDAQRESTKFRGLIELPMVGPTPSHCNGEEETILDFSRNTIII